MHLIQQSLAMQLHNTRHTLSEWKTHELLRRAIPFGRLRNYLLLLIRLQPALSNTVFME